MDKRDEFEALLNNCRSTLERFVYFKVNSKEDGDDILQEVYLTAFLKFGTLRDKDKFKAWILSVARNKINDFYRARAAVLELPLYENISYEPAFSRFGITLRETVEETLSSLADRDKQILYYFYFKQKSQDKIASILGIPLGTVKSRLHTAKQSFKERYPYPPISKGESNMKMLPEIMPDYKITKSEKEPFPVKWEELWGLFIIPKLGEELTWGIYETYNQKRSEWGEMSVTGKAMVHGIEGVEIKEHRHNRFGEGIEDHNHFYVAQLTDTHCRVLAENYEKDGIRRYFTFLDGDEFAVEWGYGKDNCGKETDIVVKSLIRRENSVITAENTDQLFDIVGRYTVTIGNRKYDTICIMSLDSYYGDYTATEQYLDKNGRTVDGGVSTAMTGLSADISRSGPKNCQTTNI